MTDCATVEQLVIHYRYIFSWKLKSKIPTMIDVLGNLKPHLGGERALALNATSIACSVEDFMTKKGLLFGALREIGTDSTLVITGKEGGAVKLVNEKQKTPTAPQSFQAVGVHCAAHKLNHQAARAVPYVSKIKELLQQLYNFKASSPV
ncbi:hypothetical protein HPB50_018787 [Hyalomma asiaticum]|uniref:Uncharacterized protein n=1 Tax=Hyalomma asiaticum TaxID=266040 RepID=A0ACB7RPB4_HYAAI|nr:hypothetical protein HPB50_018787 [Hyalomma asiaticum]